VPECEQRDPLNHRDNMATHKPGDEPGFFVRVFVREWAFFSQSERDPVAAIIAARYIALSGSRGDASRCSASTLGLLETRHIASRVVFLRRDDRAEPDRTAGTYCSVVRGGGATPLLKSAARRGTRELPSRARMHRCNRRSFPAARAVDVAGAAL
jgi:hypothetical protein